MLWVSLMHEMNTIYMYMYMYMYVFMYNISVHSTLCMLGTACRGVFYSLVVLSFKLQ